MFPFIPRKVAKSSKSVAVPKHPPTVTQPSAIQESALNASRFPQKAKGKEKVMDNGLSEDDYAILAMLSLSDHIIWADPDLRRTIASGDEGYIPLSHLMRNSPFLASLTPPVTEAVLVKTIRVHASDYLAVRMLVSEPSRSTWYERDTTKADVGGFEVRRKDWQTVLQVSGKHTRHEWETRTIYMENVPLQHRSISGIYRFTTSLLSKHSLPLDSAHAVQCIMLPRHHLDKPGDQPKCKGFALVTFLQLESAEFLLSQWPWNPRRVDVQDAESTPDSVEAVKFGFRTLPKMRWEQLKEEYLLYRQELLGEIVQADAPVHAEPATQLDYRSQPSDLPESAAEETLSGEPTHTIDLLAPYPQGCLVFVHNVHSETNKTTLRALFSQAFFGSSVQSTDAVDYVDFNKGMETCHLRLTTHHHTQLLVEYFATNLKIQTQGLDNSGADATPSTQSKAITIEVVDGTREELYWTKVPEKVRRQAVEKAYTKSLPQEELEAADDQHDTPAEGKRKRKRRKHNSQL